VIEGPFKDGKTSTNGGVKVIRLGEIFKRRGKVLKRKDAGGGKTAMIP